MLIIKLLSGLAFLGAVVWFLAQPDYEPAIVILTSLSAFISAWFAEKKMERQANQNQTVAENGIGIQAGGNIRTGDIHVSRETTNAK